MTVTRSDADTDQVRPDPESGQSAAAIQARFASLPWWRRPRKISRQLAAALVLTALLAVVTFGGLNYFAARDLLVRGTQDQLAAVGAARADSISAGTERLLAEISAASSDLSVARALEAFAPAFAALAEEELTPAQVAELDAWYGKNIVDPLEGVGLGPYEIDDLVPATAAGQWLQYHYTVRPPGQPPPLDAGDGTDYSTINANVSDGFNSFSVSKGGGDVLLIDESGTIVYSLDKRNDVGTNLVVGPYAGSALAQVVTGSLPLARVGTTLITDFTVTPTGRASLFAVSAVNSGTQVIGALAVEVPGEVLNRITSADGDWQAIGLADGDTYIVGSDGRLQSEPRVWQEDPQGYLERLRSGGEEDQAEADLVELLGSPVGIQVIDTAPVRAAVDGDTFQGSTKNYFGDATFAAAEPFTASGRQWVVVTEVPRSVALDPLTRYLMRILLVLAIVLPIVAGIGIWSSRLLTRPIRPTAEAAEAIVAGDRHPDVDTSRPDEFGDLARRLTTMANSLAAHEHELAEEYERTRQLLLAVLPPQLVDADGKVTGTGEAAERATVVAVTLRPSDPHQDREQAVDALRQAAQIAEQAAEELGLKRVRTSADRFLFLAGMGDDDAGADAAVEFARLFHRRLDSEAEVALDLHIGLSSGAVATGVLDTGSLTFGAWGDPVRRALALASLSHVDVVLVDDSTARACAPGRWSLDPAHDVVDLDGIPMDLFTLGVDDSGVTVPD